MYFTWKHQTEHSAHCLDGSKPNKLPIHVTPYGNNMGRVVLGFRLHGNVEPTVKSTQVVSPRKCHKCVLIITDHTLGLISEYCQYCNNIQMFVQGPGDLFAPTMRDNKQNKMPCDWNWSAKLALSKDEAEYCVHSRRVYIPGRALRSGLRFWPWRVYQSRRNTCRDPTKTTNSESTLTCCTDGDTKKKTLIPTCSPLPRCSLRDLRTQLMNIAWMNLTT